MTREELAEIDRINAITMHAARALFLEMFAPLMHPNGLASQILRIAGNAPQTDIRIQRAIKQLDQVPLISDGEDEPPIVARVKRLVVKGKRKRDSETAGDPRGAAEWRAELLSWALAHNNIIHLDEYRNQKFAIDYPNKTTSQTRMAVNLHELLHNKKYLDRIANKIYRITPAGEEYMRSLGAIPNPPTPSPEPPPPTEPALSDAIQAAVRNSPDHTLNVNLFRRDFEKRWKKRPMSMDAGIRRTVKSLAFEGFLRRVKPDIYRMSEEERLPRPATSAATA